MKYALLNYEGKGGYFNIGDYIQSLAAKQFLPQIDYYVNREHLSKYDNDEAKIILNGWFLHKVQNWPPSKKLIPLYISFHMNSAIGEKVLNNKINRQHFIENGPIGCRDYSTLELFTKFNIPSYFSGCLTLTLGNSYFVSERKNEILFIDPLYNYPSLVHITKMHNVIRTPKKVIKSIISFEFLKYQSLIKHLFSEIFDKALMQDAVFLDQIYSAKSHQDERFQIAHKLLQRVSQAKLVVTSRIHAALPALAVGTPVIFLQGGFKDGSDHLHRFKGLTDLFNTIYVDSKFNISSNFAFTQKLSYGNIPQNPETYKSIKTKIESKIKLFI